jgi:hypothetical protein
MPSFDQTFDDFYLVGTTGFGFQPPPPAGGNATPNRTVLAWAHFEASASGIVLIDSAAANDAGLIVVGSLNATPIPEPASTAVLASIAALTAPARLRITARENGPPGRRRIPDEPSERAARRWQHDRLENGAIAQRVTRRIRNRRAPEARATGSCTVTGPATFSSPMLPQIVFHVVRSPDAITS